MSKRDDQYLVLISFLAWALGMLFILTLDPRIGVLGLIILVILAAYLAFVVVPSDRAKR